MEGGKLFLYIAAAVVPTLILVGTLGVKLLRAGHRVRQLESREKELATLSKRRGALETELTFLSWFVKEFPRFTRELHEERFIHSIPGCINDFVIRTFDPEESLVLIRRKSAASDPGKNRQLIVAASSEKVVRMGSIVTDGRGEIGFVAQANRVLDSNDLKAGVASLADNTHEAQFGFETHLAAPLTIVRGRSLGAIALMRPKRQSVYSKPILDLIAQSSALALTSAIALSEVRNESETDALTGVRNKGALASRLEEELELAASKNTDLSVFMFDIDHFKNYNDLNGHLAGDDLLRQLTALTLEEVRRDDIFGRFGGEEFLLLLPGRSAEIAAFLADKIRERIAKHTFPFGDKQPLGKLTISGGVASTNGRKLTSNEILAAADAALYEAKDAGRNRIARAAATIEPRLD